MQNTKLYVLHVYSSPSGVFLPFHIFKAQTNILKADRTVKGASSPAQFGLHLLLRWISVLHAGKKSHQSYKHVYRVCQDLLLRPACPRATKKRHAFQHRSFADPFLVLDFLDVLVMFVED